jgi:hypothetical protein
LQQKPQRDGNESGASLSDSVRVTRAHRVGKRFGGEQRPKLLFHQRGSLQLPGGVVGRGHGADRVSCPIRERGAGPQEQAPVGLVRVDGASPTAVTLLGEALPDFGEHVVAQLDQMERVDRDRCDAAVGQI